MLLECIQTKGFTLNKLKSLGEGTGLGMKGNKQTYNQTNQLNFRGHFVIPLDLQKAEEC